MDLLQIAYYIILACGLFLILNYFKKFEDKTPSVMILIPIIYILLVSELPGVLKELIYLVILIEMLIRIYYTKVVLNQEELMNKDYYIQNYGITFILGFIVTEVFISRVNSVLPSPEELRIGIWILIILFLYKTLNGSISIKLEKQETTKLKIREESIVVKFARFKNQYFNLIRSKDKDFNLLVYAIMIYEDNCRSKFLRSMDRIIYRFTGKLMKMGIMQVESQKEISDEESIKQILKELTKIEKTLVDKKVKKQNLYQEILMEYYQNENKVQDILNIYNVLKNFDQK